MSNNPPQIAVPITVAYGDGVGSEIMEATLLVLREAGAQLAIETIEIGERIYNMGAVYGILPSAWEVLRRTKILLKAPIIIPKIPVLEMEKEYQHVDAAIYEKFGLSEGDKTTSDLAIATINENFAMFEPAHDAMPEFAGKNRASPVAMLQAATLMLHHIGQVETAQRIDRTLRRVTQEDMGTREFAEQLADVMWTT